jgi:hypothetical protein
MSHTLERRGGPYSSKVAGFGGLPNIHTDVPICAVFICLFICSALTNTVIFQRNRRRGHKFIFTILLTGFSWARVGTLVLRIAWATRPTNVRLAIAAQIFFNAGILIIYITNLVLSQRILRAKHPHLGWNPVLRIVYKMLYTSIGLALAAVIVSAVLSSYTLNLHTKFVCRDIQLAALTFLLIFTCLPIFHVVAVVVCPKSKDEETFGEGSMKSKAMIVTLSSSLCIIIAGFKAGASWSPARPITDPAWYHSKASFYLFAFTIEILILCLLTFSRIDKRFYVPDGCNQPGDYTRLREKDEMKEEHC